MTNKPNTDKTIEMISDELSVQHQISNPDFCGVSIEQHEAFKAGFDTAIKICEQRERNLVVALEQIAQLNLFDSHHAVARDALKKLRGENET